MATKYYFLCMGWMFFNAITLTAQTPINFDSVQAVIDRYPAQDTAKARMLITFSNDIRRTDQTRGIAAADQAIALAERLKQPLLIGDAYVAKGSNMYNQGKQVEGLALMEQAYQMYLQMPDELRAAKIALRSSELYYYVSEHGKMKTNGLLAVKGFQRLSDQAGLASAYNNLGVACLNLSENDQAIHYLNQAAQLYQSLNDKSGLSSCYDNYGVLYSNLSIYTEALEYFQKSLAIQQQLDESLNPGATYLNIAGIYYALKDYDLSLEYDLKALEIFKKSQNLINIGAAYVNIAAKFEAKGDYVKSLEYSQLGREILEPLNAQQFLAICISNSGLTRIKLNQNAQAYPDLLDAANRFEDMGFSAEVARVKVGIGDCINQATPTDLQKMGIDSSAAPALAEKYALEGIETAQETGAIDFEQNGFRVLSLIQEHAGNYTQALASFQRYIALRDSISSEDIRQQITRKEIQFEFDKKEAGLKFEQQLTREQLEKQQLLTFQQQQALRLNQQALTLSNQEKDLQRLAYLKEKAEKQDKEQELSLAQKDKQLQEVQLGALLQEKALQLKTLAEKNALIGLLIAGILAILLAVAALYFRTLQKQARKEAETQAKFTRQLLENIEDDRGRIAIDLHDSVSHELLLLKQSVRKDITGPEFGHKIDDIINGIRQISRNLHPVMLDKIGLQLSLETLCEQFMQHETMYVSHDIQYQNNLSKSAELQLFRIVQEGLTNALKYAKAEAVKVQLKSVGTSLQLEIQDNGNGFDVARALNSGKAFGLHSIIQRAKAIGGQAEIKSTGQGVTIRVVV